MEQILSKKCLGGFASMVSAGRSRKAESRRRANRWMSENAVSEKNLRNELINNFH